MSFANIAKNETAPTVRAGQTWAYRAPAKQGAEVKVRSVYTSGPNQGVVRYTGRRTSEMRMSVFVKRFRLVADNPARDVARRLMQSAQFIVSIDCFPDQVRNRDDAAEAMRDAVQLLLEYAKLNP